MDSQNEVSIKFSNEVKDEKKLQEYEERLSRIYSFINGLNSGQSKAFAKIDSATKATTKEVDITEKSVEKLGKQFSIAFNTKALSVFLKGLQNISKQMFSLISTSSEYIENVNLLEVAYSNANETIAESSKRVEDFIDKMAEAYGLDESRLTRQFGIFKQLANAMKLPTEQAENLSELMVKMTNDVASLYNLDLERASNALQSALTGQVRPIRSATGADITEKTLQTTVDNLGLEKSISDLSFVEKRLVMVISLTDQLKNSQGDYARTIESASNQIRVMHEQWDRLSRAVGNVFYPILAKILPYLNAVLMVLTDIFNLIASLMGFEMPEFDYSGLSGASDATLDLIDGMNDASDSADKLKQKLSGLRGFDKLNVISTPKASDTSSATGGINPKIMDAFNNAFSKYDDMMDSVRMKAREIRDAIEDWLGFTDGSYKNLKLIGAVLGAIIGLKLIKGIKNLITGTGTLARVLGTGGLFKALKNIYTLYKQHKLADTLRGKIANLIIKGTNLISVILRVASAIAGIILTVKGGIDVYKSFKATVDGVTTSTKNLAIGMGEMVAGGALIGTAILPGWGTAIGALVGLLGGAVVALKSYNDAQVEVLKKNIFGELNISVQQWTDMLNSSGFAVDNLKSKQEALQSTLEGLKNTVDTNVEQLTIYGIKFGTLAQQISEEDMNKILTSIENTSSSAISTIDEATNYGFGLLQTSFANGTSFTEEEQGKILQSIITNGESQKDAIKTAQDTITTTWKNAIAERGYLTDEEKKTIEEAMNTIKNIVNQNYEENKADMEYYKTKFNDRSLELDEESYSNWKTARDKFQKDQEKTINENYKTQYAWAVAHADELGSVEGGLEKYLEDIYNNRNTAINELNTDLESYQADLTKSLKERYEELGKSSDGLTEEQKKNNEKQRDIIKKTLIEMGEWEDGTDKSAKQVFDNLQKPFDNPIEIKLTLDDKDFRNRYNKVANEVNKSLGASAISTKIQYGYQGLPIIAQAKGGLPPVGQLFIANEQGPELVGQIGGQSFVANQNQMMDLLDKKIGNAQSQPMNATFVIQVGSKEVARQVITDLQGMAKSNGKPVVIGG